MKYMLLIYTAEELDPQPPTPEFGALIEGYMAFTNEVTEKGVLVSSDALDPVDTASTVRVRNGKSEVTDGPFAETKEQLGGFYLLDCANLDEALAYAAKIPSAASGSIEVRPIRSFE